MVGIGLPVYNGARFLASALESLLAQDFTDFEIVVTDNASTDDSLAIARSFARADSRVRVHHEPTNRGAAWNFNEAFRLSRGKYFKWAAHDDRYEPTFLGRCLEALERNPDVTLAYTQTLDIDEDDRVLCRRPAPDVAREREARDRLRSFLRVPTPCFEVFGLFRRRDLATTSLIGAYTGSDRTLLMELAARGRFHLVDDYLFLHRQHADRSVHRYPRGRDRSAWFDPRLHGAITFPRWRLLAEYARVIRTAPLSPSDRLGTSLDLARWAVEHRVALVRQGLGGLRDMATLAAARSLAALRD